MNHAVLAFFGPVGWPELVIIFLVFAMMAVLVVLPYWFIFSKAGYPGALALLMLVPLADIVMRFFLAFSKWPLERKLEDAQAPPAPPPPPA